MLTLLLSIMNKYECAKTFFLLFKCVVLFVYVHEIKFLDIQSLH